MRVRPVASIPSSPSLSLVPRSAYSLLLASAAVWTAWAGFPVTAQAQADPDSAVVVDSLVVAESPVVQDSGAPPETGSGRRRHSPRGALWRALAVPGWGQLYNRQIYKLPFVYAALGGVGVFAVSNTTRHREARRAFLYAAGLGEDPNPYQVYAPFYVGTRYEGLTAQRLFEFKNGLRRNRDLAYLGVIVVYGLTVLDAFVAAHIYDFDVSEDLSVVPWSGPAGWGMSVHVRW